MEGDENYKKVVVYLCSQCSAVFESEDLARAHRTEQHEITVGSEGSIQDSTSGEDETSDTEEPILEQEQQEQSIHIRVEVSKETREKDRYNLREPSQYKCSRPKCPASFPEESMLSQHVACHTESRPFQCTECSFTVPTWAACAVHLFKAHGIDCNLLTCAICQNYKTYYPISLENHMRIHGDVKAFVCSACGQAFKQPSQLRNHNMVSHNAVPRVQAPQPCNICYKIYSNSKALQKHKEEVHNRKKPFVCNVCGHASARKWMLKLHQRQHTGHKPYQCTFCSFCSPDQSTLRRHIMSHTGVRQYRCNDCGYECMRSSSLKHHIQSKHPDQYSKVIHSCPNCPFKTVSLDRYTRHVSDHLTGTIKADEDHASKLVVVASEFPLWIAVDSPSSHEHSEPAKSIETIRRISQTSIQ